MLNSFIIFQTLRVNFPPDEPGTPRISFIGTNFADVFMPDVRAAISGPKYNSKVFMKLKHIFLVPLAVSVCSLPLRADPPRVYFEQNEGEGGKLMVDGKKYELQFWKPFESVQAAFAKNPEAYGALEVANNDYQRSKIIQLTGIGLSFGFFITSLAVKQLDLGSALLLSGGVLSGSLWYAGTYSDSANFHFLKAMNCYNEVPSACKSRQKKSSWQLYPSIVPTTGSGSDSGRYEGSIALNISFIFPSSPMK